LRTSITEGVALHLTLFTVALCTLLFEVLLTRVLSVVMWYHFTFAVISISLLGIASGAIRCYTRFSHQYHEIARDPWNVISRRSTLFSVAVVLPIVLLTWFVATPTFSFGGGLLLTAYFAACAAPFYASGYLTAAIFRFGSARVSSLYAVDLLGASLGCLLSIPLLDRLGGVASLLLVSVLSALVSWAASWRSLAPSRRTTALVTALALSGVLVFQVSRTQVDVRTVKLSAREEMHRIVDVKWNSHSRLALLDYFDPSAKTAFPFLAWGLSDRYAGWLPRQYLITIDGASETPLTELKEDVAAHEYLAYDITALPYHLRPGAKALVIGAGGGRDILTALWFGSPDVTGVELNRDIVRWVRERYARFAGHVYSRPEVRIVVDDGRNFVRASRETYDVVQISMIDTFAATAAGAYTLSENNLYTAEAFDEYLEHLRPDGVLSINRFFLDPPDQTLRVVTLAREALGRRGIRDSAGHVAAIKKGSPLGDNGLVLVKVAPFTAAEIQTLRRLCESLGFEPVALPGARSESPLSEYLAAPEPAAFYETYPFDVRPPTDDRPFFFNTLKISALLGSLELRQLIEPIRVYNFDAVFILFILLGLAGVALCLFIFVPLFLSRTSGEPRLPARSLAYFVLVGLGFILVEIVLIQRFHLYLGHPVYSLAVVLFTLLASSGIGSAWTARWAHGGLGRHLTIGCAAALLLIVLHQVLWPVFLATTLGLSRSMRIALAIVSLLPLGISMGMPYPLGLRVISAVRPTAMPWVWAVNGAASVLGSILAFALAMAMGFATVLLLGGLCYAGALLSGLFLLVPRDASVSLDFKKPQGVERPARPRARAASRPPGFIGVARRHPE
jgi:SAM-dependent methyltransferase